MYSVISDFVPRNGDVPVGGRAGVGLHAGIAWAWAPAHTRPGLLKTMEQTSVGGSLLWGAFQMKTEGLWAQPQIWVLTFQDRLGEVQARDGGGE